MLGIGAWRSGGWRGQVSRVKQTMARGEVTHLPFRRPPAALGSRPCRPPLLKRPCIFNYGTGYSHSQWSTRNVHFYIATFRTACVEPGILALFLVRDHEQPEQA